MLIWKRVFWNNKKNTMMLNWKYNWTEKFFLIKISNVINFIRNYVLYYVIMYSKLKTNTTKTDQQDSPFFTRLDRNNNLFSCLGFCLYKLHQALILLPHQLLTLALWQRCTMLHSENAANRLWWASSGILTLPGIPLDVTIMLWQLILSFNDNYHFTSIILF